MNRVKQQSVNTTPFQQIVFQKYVLNHTIYLTDAQSVASKWILRELKNSFYVQECKDDENSEADDA